jgi:MFS family permease
MKRKNYIELIASLLVLLFMYAAVSKLLDYEKFVYQLGKSPYIENYAHTVAWSIPAGEILISLALLFQRSRLLGLYASFGIMLMFSIYIYVMLNYSYYVPCSCGGVLSKMSWQQHFWFNIAFTLLALTGILLTIMRSRPKTKNTPQTEIAFT